MCSYLRETGRRRLKKKQRDTWIKDTNDYAAAYYGQPRTYTVNVQWVSASYAESYISKPSKNAWEVALHMLQWMWQEKERGIIFRSDRGSAPVAFSDASNQADPEDGLVQAGFNIMMAGGPVVYGSRKLKHCSPT